MKNTYSKETKLGTFTSDFKKNARGNYELKLDGKKVAIFFNANKAMACQARLDYQNSL